MRPKSLIEAACVVAAASIITVAMTFPLACQLGRVGRIDTGDGRWSIWAVNWIARTVVVDPLHVFDANIFYPHRATLAYSEPNLMAGVLAVPAYWATRNPFFAHNFVLLLSFVLSAAGGYYLARYLTGSRPAAAVAASLFAFCPYVFAHTAHIQLLMSAGLPFSLLAFHRLADAPSAGRATALGAALALTGLSCGYYGIYAGLLVSVGALYYLVVRRRWRDWRYMAAIAGAALVAAASLWPALKPYVDLGEGNRPVRQLRDQFLYSATWSSYLASSGLLHRWMLPHITAWRDVVFPGFTALVLGGVGTWVGLRTIRAGSTPTTGPVGSGGAAVGETVGFYALAAAFTLWLSFGPKAWLYSAVYDIFPFFSLMRAPVRLALLVDLSLCMLAAIGLAHMLRGRRHAVAWAAVVAAIALTEMTPVPLRFREVPPDSPVYTTLAALPAGPVVELPFFWRPREGSRHTWYMCFSTRHWKPLVNGYSDYSPPDFVENGPTINSFPSRQALDVLRRYPVRYVVVHLDMYGPEERAVVAAGLEQFRDELRPLAPAGDVRLFEVTSWQGDVQSVGISSHTPR